MIYKNIKLCDQKVTSSTGDVSYCVIYICKKIENRTSRGECYC